MMINSHYNNSGEGVLEEERSPAKYEHRDECRNKFQGYFFIPLKILVDSRVQHETTISFDDPQSSDVNAEEIIRRILFSFAVESGRRKAVTADPTDDVLSLDWVEDVGDICEKNCVWRRPRRIEWRHELVEHQLFLPKSIARALWM